MPVGSDRTGDQFASLPGDGPELTLEVALYPSVDQTVLRMLGLWRARHPAVAVRLTSRAMRDHHRAMAEALASVGGVPDVIAIEATHIGGFAARGGLEDLSKATYGAEAHALRVAPHALPPARDATGALIAFPADTAPGALFYRRDLFDRAGVDVAALATWDGVIAAGRRLRQACDVALLSHLGGLAVLRAREGIPAGEGVYFDAGGAPRLRSERFVAALELAREARAAAIDARITEEWTSRWEASIASGLVAAQPGGPWLLGMLETFVAPELRGAWRCADLPGGVRAPWGGTYYALPHASPNRQLAWEWVKLMCLDPRVQLQAFEHNGAFPALTGALADAFLDEPLPFLGGQPARRLWLRAADALPALPAHRLDAFAGDALRAALHAVVDEGVGVAAALADAERRVSRRLEEAGG